MQKKSPEAAKNWIIKTGCQVGTDHRETNNFSELNTAFVIAAEKC